MSSSWLSYKNSIYSLLKCWCLYSQPLEFMKITEHSRRKQGNAVLAQRSTTQDRANIITHSCFFFFYIFPYTVLVKGQEHCLNSFQIQCLTYEAKPSCYQCGLSFSQNIFVGCFNTNKKYFVKKRHLQFLQLI